MTVLWFLGAAFTLWMAVDAVRSQRAFPWLWVILFLPPFGAAAYFLAEHFDTSWLPRLRPRGVARPGRADVDRALRDVRRLDTAHAWTEYASLLNGRGSSTRALEAADEALRREPGAADARWERGRALLALERFSDALPELAAVVDADDDHANGEALLALARARERAGDVAGARRDLEHLIERHSGPGNLYALASVQHAGGDPAAARGTLQRLLDEAQYVPRYLRGDIRPWVWRARALLAKLP